MVGFEPGTCDIDLVVEPTSSPALTLVRVCERLNVPPSWACARALEFSTGPLPLFMLTPVWDLPLTEAALPPAAIEEPVLPVGDVDVPPVPTVEAEVPPAAAEPPLPPVMLFCARTGEAAASRAATAAVVSKFLMFQSSINLG